MYSVLFPEDQREDIRLGQFVKHLLDAQYLAKRSRYQAHDLAEVINRSQG